MFLESFLQKIYWNRSYGLFHGSDIRRKRLIDSEMIKNYILKWLLLILSQLYFEVNSHPIKYISSFYSMLTCQNFAERNEWITKIYTQLLRFCNEKNFTVFIANQVHFCVLVLSSSLGVCSSSIRWIQYSSWYSASILMGMNRINHLWNTSETCNDINSHLLYTWTVCISLSFFYYIDICSVSGNHLFLLVYLRTWSKSSILEDS